MEPKKHPVIKQGNRIIPHREKTESEKKPIVHQNGRTIKGGLPRQVNHRHAVLIAQNNKAVHGHPDAIREYNKTSKRSAPELPKELNGDSDFDNSLYETRLQQFANSEKEELIDLYGKLDKILPEDKRALLETMKNRGFDVPAIAEAEEGDFNKDLYANALKMFKGLKNGKIKQLQSKINNLIPEEQKALKEIIAERKLKA